MPFETTRLLNQCSEAPDQTSRETYLTSIVWYLAPYMVGRGVQKDQNRTGTDPESN